MTPPSSWNLKGLLRWYSALQGPLTHMWVASRTTSTTRALSVWWTRREGPRTIKNNWRKPWLCDCRKLVSFGCSKNCEGPPPPPPPYDPQDFNEAVLITLGMSSLVRGLCSCSSCCFVDPAKGLWRDRMRMAEWRVPTTPSGAHPCSGQGLQVHLNRPSCNSSHGKTRPQNTHSILEGNTSLPMPSMNTTYFLRTYFYYSK